MQIEGLIPFRSSIDQAIASLYFFRICNDLRSLFSDNSADMITGFPFLVLRKHISDDWAILSQITLMH